MNALFHSLILQIFIECLPGAREYKSEQQQQKEIAPAFKDFPVWLGKQILKKTHNYRQVTDYTECSEEK